MCEVPGVEDIHLGIINSWKACRATGLEEVIWIEKTAQPAKCSVSKAGGNPENQRNV